MERVFSYYPKRGYTVKTTMLKITRDIKAIQTALKTVFEFIFPI
jgi:hypothetical protein